MDPPSWRARRGADWGTSSATRSSRYGIAGRHVHRALMWTVGLLFSSSGPRSSHPTRSVTLPTPGRWERWHSVWMREQVSSVPPLLVAVGLATIGVPGHGPTTWSSEASSPGYWGSGCSSSPSTRRAGSTGNGAASVNLPVSAPSSDYRHRPAPWRAVITGGVSVVLLVIARPAAVRHPGRRPSPPLEESPVRVLGTIFLVLVGITRRPRQPPAVGALLPSSASWPRLPAPPQRLTIRPLRRPRHPRGR